MSRSLASPPTDPADSTRPLNDERQDQTPPFRTRLENLVYPLFEPLAVWRRKNRNRLGLAALAALVVIVVYYLTAISPWNHPSGDLWQLGGMTKEQIRTADLPADWRHLLSLDNGLAALAVITLSFLALSFDSGRGTKHLWSLHWWHIALTGLAIATYGGADAAENWYVRRLLEHQATVDDGEARWLAFLTHAKWTGVALAILLILAMWSRQTRHALPTGEPKRHPPAEPRWLEPNGRRSLVGGPGSDLPWGPADDRLGISVSGGGIRSAAFAFGALSRLHELGLVERARYVTSVSGGSYATSAFTALNQSPATGTGPRKPAPFSIRAPETQAVRRNLRYLVSDKRVVAGAVARIVLGMGMNLLLLYALIFAAARPVGWLIGSIHPELRLGQSSVTSVEAGPCGADQEPPTLTIGKPFSILGRPDVAAWEVTVGDVQACAKVAESVRATPKPTAVTIKSQPGVVSVVDGHVVVEQQPSSVASFGSTLDDLPYDLLTVAGPTLSVKEDRLIDASGTPQAAALEIKAPAATPASVFSLRDHVTIDGWQWQIPLAFVALSIGLLIIRVTRRPTKRWHRINLWATISAGLGASLLGLFVVLPLLADDAPRWLVDAANTAPSSDALAKLSWLPGAGQLPVLLVWPLLSVTAVWRFFKGVKPTTAPSTPTARNKTAMVKKYVTLAEHALVGLVTVAAAFIVSIVAFSSGALNGPGGRRPTFIDDITRWDTAKWTRPDLLVWCLVVGVLIISSGWSESWAWSPGPIYRRRLAAALFWRREAEHGAEPLNYEPDELWGQLAPVPFAGGTVADWLTHVARAGYLDGEAGDGTELVLCCSANILGSGRAPTDRSAVSFTASRSLIGIPEVGWVPTSDYVGRLSQRRRRDVILPGVTALSGAAVSSAMGKQSIGYFGPVLALLNLRLGAWLPNPAWIAALDSEQEWQHNPSWPWYLREVGRRFGSAEPPYFYISDGGHWENLGLVEALRRGCTNIVMISAAGDGDLSNGTLADAIEIARTDLGVEIELDDAWKTRPLVGGDTPATLPSGRQFVVEPGPSATLGRAAPQGFAFGTITFPDRPEDKTKGHLLLIEAAMVDELPLDVHAYAEAHPEFPNVSTGDQLFTDEDFEAYRVLGATMVDRALSSVEGKRFSDTAMSCQRTDPASATDAIELIRKAQLHHTEALTDEVVQPVLARLQARTSVDRSPEAAVVAARPSRVEVAAGAGNTWIVKLRETVIELPEGSTMEAVVEFESVDPTASDCNRTAIGLSMD